MAWSMQAYWRLGAANDSHLCGAKLKCRRTLTTPPPCDPCSAKMSLWQACKRAWNNSLCCTFLIRACFPENSISCCCSNLPVRIQGSETDVRTMCAGSLPVMITSVRNSTRRTCALFNRAPSTMMLRVAVRNLLYCAGKSLEFFVKKKKFPKQLNSILKITLHF